MTSSRLIFSSVIRLHQHNVSHVQPIRVWLHIARDAVDAIQRIVNPQAVNRHVGISPMADVFSLGVGLPIDGAHRLPVLIVAVAAAGAVDGTIDAHDWARRGGAEGLAELDDGRECGVGSAECGGEGGSRKAKGGSWNAKVWIWMFESTCLCAGDASNAEGERINGGRFNVDV